MAVWCRSMSLHEPLGNGLMQSKLYEELFKYLKKTGIMDRIYVFFSFLSFTIPLTITQIVVPMYAPHSRWVGSGHGPFKLVCQTSTNFRRRFMTSDNFI